MQGSSKFPSRINTGALTSIQQSIIGEKPNQISVGANQKISNPQISYYLKQGQTSNDPKINT